MSTNGRTPDEAMNEYITGEHTGTRIDSDMVVMEFYDDDSGQRQTMLFGGEILRIDVDGETVYETDDLIGEVKISMNK